MSFVMKRISYSRMLLSRKVSREILSAGASYMRDVDSKRSLMHRDTHEPTPVSGILLGSSPV